MDFTDSAPVRILQVVCGPHDAETGTTVDATREPSLGFWRSCALSVGLKNSVNHSSWTIYFECQYDLVFTYIREILFQAL